MAKVWYFSLYCENPVIDDNIKLHVWDTIIVTLLRYRADYEMQQQNVYMTTPTMALSIRCDLIFFECVFCVLCMWVDFRLLLSCII